MNMVANLGCFAESVEFDDVKQTEKLGQKPCIQ